MKNCHPWETKPSAIADKSFPHVGDKINASREAFRVLKRGKEPSYVSKSANLPI